jgi:predicted Fe-Mo cluster-binding NifX family protein
MPQLQSQASADTRLKKELAVANPIGRGKGKGARLVQELLRINGVNIVIDSDFGPATEAGLAQFCTVNKLPVSKTVDQALLDALAQPLLRVAQPIKPEKTLGDTVAANARRHLAEHPIEVGLPNSGPWVRLYMGGSEGKAFPWCAGFVTYVVRQAAAAHNVPSPITRTFSCDVIGAEAKKNKKFVKRVSPTQAPPGSIFLVPQGVNPNDWVHTGIIVEPHVAGPSDVFATIEGNTNDEGSREGFEVCQRIRSCSKVDVVLL